MNPRVPYKDTEVERAKIEHNKDTEERIEWETPQVFQAIVLDNPPLDSTNCGTCYDAF